MIDPSNTYVGLACFLNENAVWPNTTSAEFSSIASWSETKSSGREDCSVILDVQASALTNPSVLIREQHMRGGSFDKGDSLVLGLGMNVNFEGFNSKVWIPGNVTWSSNAPGVAAIIRNGSAAVVSITGTGTASITGVAASGHSASLSLTSNHSFGNWSTVSAPTALMTGSKERVCGICGEKQTETIEKLSPFLNVSKNKVTVKKTKTVSVKAAVATGDSVTVRSSNTKIATGVWNNGILKITAKKKAGKATLTLTTATNKSTVITVTVPKVATTKITCKAVKVKKGKKVTLKPVVKPSLSDDKITYKVKNSKIASVSKTGVVKGKKKGTTYVTVKSGKKSIKVKITVK